MLWGHSAVLHNCIFFKYEGCLTYQVAKKKVKVKVSCLPLGKLLLLFALAHNRLQTGESEHC